MLKLFKQIIHSTRFSRVSILGVVATSLLLTGCIGVQTNLGFYGDGQWSGVQAITLSPEFVQLRESEGSDGSELATKTAGLDEWIQRAQDADADESLNVTFNEVTDEDSSRTYVLQAEGSQYETLNEVLFEGKADISVADVDGQRQITIRFDPSETTEGQAMQEEAMSAEMMGAFGAKVITRISGGEIISHNADRVEGNTAIWETPGLVEITLTEAALFDPGTLAPQDMQVGGSGPALTTLLEGREQSAENTPTEEGTAESAEILQETAPATDSASEEQALPVSGAILPNNSSVASLVLAGLVLIALVGTGIATAGLNRE